MNAQHDQLVEGISGFLSQRPNGYLKVEVAQSLKQVDFLFIPTGRRDRPAPRMRVLIYEADAALRVAALRAGLRDPSHHELYMRFGPRRGQVIPYLRYLTAVTSPDEAARRCFAALREIFGVKDDDQLVITSEPIE